MKLSICNDLFQGWREEAIFRFAAETGYDGIEIAPFMYEDNVKEIGHGRRQEIRDRAASFGLEIVGLHWVLVGPEGVYLTHPDREVRKATRDYLLYLIEFCGDIGGDTIVFGSPRQRNIRQDVSRKEAYQYAAEIFIKCMNYAEDRGVVICIEPLGGNETNFVTSIDEALDLVEMVNHTNFKTMVDIKAALAEKRPVKDVILEANGYLHHIHLNDYEGLAPGFGSTNFKPIIDQLEVAGYNRYLSIEVFQLKTGIKETARKSYEYLKRFIKD